MTSIVQIGFPARQRRTHQPGPCWLVLGPQRSKREPRPCVAHGRVALNAEGALRIEVAAGALAPSLAIEIERRALAGELDGSRPALARWMAAQKKKAPRSTRE